MQIFAFLKRSLEYFGKEKPETRGCCVHVFLVLWILITIITVQIRNL